VIMFGIIFQILQLVVSIRRRKENLDLTGDPWDGRTLEWSIASPPPAYNFATTPVVRDRDAFWGMKARRIRFKPSVFEPIHMPRNTGTGLIVGGFSVALGFALIWHIWWMALAGAAVIIGATIIHSYDSSRDHSVPAEEVAQAEAGRFRQLASQA
jgi:cytochrome o ubiquinol oxidase subunit I